jgi:hypothetical protein
MILNVSAYISPVKLPPSNLGDLQGGSVIVSGWGKTSDSEYIVLSFYCLVLKTTSINKTSRCEETGAFNKFSGHLE